MGNDPEDVELISTDEYDRDGTDPMVSARTDDGTFVAVRPKEDQDEEPGRRLRVEVDDSGLVNVVDEVTLPERVGSVDARHRKQVTRMLLTLEEYEWLVGLAPEILKNL